MPVIEMFARETQASGPWIVRRHSGRAGAQERAIFVGGEIDARARYQREATKLRQGVVALMRPDGSAEARTGAPRLRTRW